MRITAIIGFLILCNAGTGFAQSRRGESPSTVDPGGAQDEYRIFRGGESKKSKRSKNRLSFTDQKIQEYENRQEANAKRAREQAKEMEKPRYSDPSYFGHKSKPKKRSPGKKKFCKQCGISH
jgi:membrane protein involved in colicin uptake